MKTLLIAFFLGLLLSGNVYAKKTEITSTWNGGEMTLGSKDGQGCMFAGSSPFSASYHVHRNAALGLQLMVGDEVTSLGTWILPNRSNGTVTWYSGCIFIPFGEDWSMVWTLESTTRGRVLDAEEVLSGTCEP